jgi:uncharacterized protein (TIGR02217 family)
MTYLNFPSPTPVFPVLPPLTWSVFRKPILASRVSIAASGREAQIAQAAYPRFAFKLSYGKQSWLRERTQNITPWAPLNAYTELEQITGLYLACQGPYGEFYYSDPDDNSRFNQFCGTGNGSNTFFPLFVTWGTGPFTPPMRFPVGGINVLNALYVGGFNYLSIPGWVTINSDNASVTITAPSPPSNGASITADFSFYYRCRFLDDHMSLSEWAKNLWEVNEVNFESVKM